MKYTDGNEAHVGDVVLIDGKHNGVVVASIDTNEYTDAHPKEQWAYLGRGIMVDTDFGGLIHYPDVGLALRTRPSLASLGAADEAQCEA